jgi:hypothetical protein
MKEPIFKILFGSGFTIDIADDGVVSGTHPDLQDGQYAVMNRISSRIATERAKARSEGRPPIDLGLSFPAVDYPGGMVFINRGEQPEDYADLDCPACGGSGHKGDASVTEHDLAFLAWAKAHRGSYIREFERLQRRDAKKAEKEKE